MSTAKIALACRLRCCADTNCACRKPHPHVPASPCCTRVKHSSIAPCQARHGPHHAGIKSAYPVWHLQLSIILYPIMYLSLLLLNLFWSQKKVFDTRIKKFSLPETKTNNSFPGLEAIYIPLGSRILFAPTSNLKTSLPLSMISHSTLRHLILVTKSYLLSCLIGLF